jgi:hypothetical protein
MPGRRRFGYATTRELSKGRKKMQTSAMHEAAVMEVCTREAADKRDQGKDKMQVD